jgi:hypothetical protein
MLIMNGKFFIRLFFLLCVFIISQDVDAQYKFYVSMSFNYNCHGNRECEELVRMTNGMIQNAISGIPISFNTKNECEAARNMTVNSLNEAKSLASQYSSYGVKLNFTVTPCSGFGGGNFVFLGPNRGSSFYSPSVADEIKNWSEDNERLQAALNPEWEHSEQTAVETSDYSFDEKRKNLREGLVIDTDKPFVSLNMRDDWRSSSPDLDILDVELKPVQFVTENEPYEPFDEEGVELSRDWGKLGKDIGLYAYSVSKNLTAKSVAVLGLASDFTINLYAELYRAARQTYRGEIYYADSNIFTETAVYWGGHEYAMTGNIIYNTAKATLEDLGIYLGKSAVQKGSEKAFNFNTDDVVEKTTGIKKGSDLISIAADAEILIIRTINYKENEKSE